MEYQDTSLLGRQLDHLQIADSVGAHTHRSDGDYPPTDTSAATNSESSFPIALMTPELLSSVFVAALPVVHTAKDVKALSIRHAPLNVSHVCKFWRNVALSTPQLWVQIFFDIQKYKLFGAFSYCGALDEDDDGHTDTRRFAKGMSVASSIPVFLGRSVEQTLYVNINVDVIPKNYKFFGNSSLWTELERWDRLRTEVMPCLVKSQFRWTMASISSFPMTWWYGNDEAALREMERLISREGDDQPVSFHTQDDSDNDRPVIGHNSQHSFIVDFSRGSRLVHLSINTAGNTFLRFRESFSFPNLVDLEICVGCQLDADQISDLLTRTPRLCRLALGMSEGEFKDVVGNWRTVHLQELRSLQLHCKYSVETILCRLTAPSLQSLGIHTSDYFRGGHVRDMLHRSNSKLTQLSFSSNIYSPARVGELLTCLEATPFLHELELRMSRSMDTVLQRLIVCGGTGELASSRNLCPMLQSLTLRNLHSSSLPLVVQVAKTRSPAGNGTYSTQIDSTRADDQTGHGTAVLRRLDVVLKVTRRRSNRHYVSDAQPDVDREISELCARGLEYSVRPYGEGLMRFGRDEGGYYIDETSEDEPETGRDFEGIPDSD